MRSSRRRNRNALRGWEVARLCVACGLSLLAVSPLAAATNKIILRVNERIATSFDYQTRKATQVQGLRMNKNLTTEQVQERLARLGESVMNELLEELLVISRADQLNITVSESDIDRSIEQAKQGFGIETDEDFDAALRSSGMTRESMRAQMEVNLLIRQVMGREVQPRVTLAEEDLRRYYQAHSEDFQVPERLRLKEIVILDSAELGLQDRILLAEEIREKLLAGGEISEVAQPYSDRGIATGAIDLGWVEAGDLARDLEQAVWSLQSGEVSSPIEGRGGSHLIQVVERQEARLRGFVEVQDEIANQEQGRRYQIEVEKYMEELRTSSYIFTDPPPEAAGFRNQLGSLSVDLPGLEQAARALTAIVPEGSIEDLPGVEVVSEGDEGPPAEDEDGQ